MSWPRFSPAAALSVGGGFLVALSLPPWGLWPLAFAGIVAFDISLGAEPNRRQRATRGWLFGAAWMSMGMGWMWFLTAPGYVVAAALFAGLHSLAARAVPTGSVRVVGRPIAHALAESVRLFFPFGGVPLATLPIGQANGPLLGVVRVGGVVLLTWVVLQVGFSLAELARRGATREWSALRGSWAAAVAAVVFVIVLGSLAPDGRSTSRSQPDEVRVALVQGGGEQGTRAINTSSRLVTERHLAATSTIPAGSVDVVIWPENAIDVDVFDTSIEREEIAAQARRIGAPIVVGVTEDITVGDERRFTNAQLVVGTDGTLVSRYDKVRRVPFGEYVPMRGVLESLGAPTDLVPRNAVPGTEPALLRLPDSDVSFAVVISWEVFFGGRANEGVEAGGTFIANPTNGSSYTGTVLQSQQIASSKLRAVEQGRFIAQVSPTGYSAFIDADGNVLQRTAISEQKVLFDEVTLADGRTWYSRLGDRPFILALAAGLTVLGVNRWRRRPLRPSPSPDRR
jgi:apolipoprotein N-acyltransferase